MKRRRNDTNPVVQPHGAIADGAMPNEQSKLAQQPLNGHRQYGTSTRKRHDPQSESLTISYDESLAQIPWQTDNDYIRTGYRRHLPSIKACVGSAFTCQ